MKKLFLATIVLCLMFQIQAVAEVIMPLAFGDGMVLQRDMPLRIFGEASEGARITVRINGQSETSVSGDGKWNVTLKPMPAGGPYELHVSGDGDEIIFRDVMLGEVWLAGGQSNMAQALLSQIDFETYLPEEENPELRFIHIPVTEFGEINRTGVEWNYFDQESVKTFSAVAFFFATELQKRLGVTVGIIGSYRGGTWNENWMTPESIKNEPGLKYLFENYEKEYAKFKDEAAYEEAYQEFLSDLSEWRDKGGWSYGMVPFAPLGPKAYQRPSGLYNTMIKPLQPYTIRGCIWYQGEGNSARHEEFRTLFPAFVEGWRKTWQNQEMPFYFVQLPGYGKGATWPQFRQAQLDCSKKIDHCGMVVSEGCHDENDIHPRVKKPIGDRLAIAASAEVYGQDHIPYGPIFRSAKFQRGKAKVSFEYSGSGLELRSEDAGSFEIAGADKVYTEAQVAVKGSKLLLWSDRIEHPVYVRYAYSPNPEMVLFNQEGLPASPFTTEK
jgi:sialate O-acetylesterase